MDSIIQVVESGQGYGKLSDSITADAVTRRDIGGLFAFIAENVARRLFRLGICSRAGKLLNRTVAENTQIKNPDNGYQ